MQSLKLQEGHGVQKWKHSKHSTTQVPQRKICSNCTYSILRERGGEDLLDLLFGANNTLQGGEIEEIGGLSAKNSATLTLYVFQSLLQRCPEVVGVIWKKCKKSIQVKLSGQQQMSCEMHFLQKNSLYMLRPFLSLLSIYKKCINISI